MERLSASLVFLLVPLQLWGQANNGPAPDSLVLTHITVIDGTGAPPKPDQTVVLGGGRILRVGKAGEVAGAADAHVVDASGKFLIPGLWDMHVHIGVNKDWLTLCIANGVTGVREMANFAQPIFAWRKEIADGKFLGPRIVASGPIVDGPKPIWPFSIAAGNAAEGRTAVQSLKKQGADFIKVYTKLPREAYFAVADESRKQGLVFAGHVPSAIRAAEASDAGQKSMEHLYGVLAGCSAREDELLQEATLALKSPSFDPVLRRRRLEKALDSYDQSRAAELFARFVKNGTWQVPTLTVLRAIALLKDEAFTQDPRLKYVSAAVRQSWDPKTAFLFKSWTADDFAFEKKHFQRELELVRAMHRAGVQFLAGTDVYNPYCFPGFSLHDELELLVKECGFTPLEALQTATRNPAQFLGRFQELGTVAAGKRADLVVLDADPLADIAHTRRIHAVVVAGKFLSRTSLDQMLSEVEAARAAKKSQ